ncbi:MAG: FAD-dependent thymidylate synthase [Candidatus Cloacimonadaceae bacterium]|nr:FAD-dependent thymidylate synthase [Candidatus Cloacimonadaceae bacterium]MDP3115023.1 FAD-dependent thymidylate synthase [Candidatus Cloacimonadaceae bacterium]
MKVLVAGYNIDSSLLEKIAAANRSPEVISAAYARISRSSKTVSELRKEALGEIGKARKSNQNIIFEMGHASVAEHAVFNLDLIGISRHLTEVVQRSRYASFTEKSQRYVTFDHDYVIPEELNEFPAIRDRYIRLCDELFNEYKLSMDKLLELYDKDFPDLKPRELEGKAKEDARYILPLSTKTQMGATINARSIETLLRRLGAREEMEARQLHGLIFASVSSIAPSLLRYTQADDFNSRLPETALPHFPNNIFQMPDRIALVSAPQNADDMILAGLFFEQGYCDFPAALNHLENIAVEEKSRLWEHVFQGIKAWHKMPRAFENAEFAFQIPMSECCWGQFKRHRSATMLKYRSQGQGSAAHLSSRLIFPEGILSIGREKIWQSLFKAVSDFRKTLPTNLSHLAPYTVLNAESALVHARMNLREIYHFCRLRSDEHAQWEIRQISDEIIHLVKTHAPYATRFLMGKSDFNTVS